MGILNFFRRDALGTPAKASGRVRSEDEALAERLVNEGNELADRGRFREAHARYDAALAVCPTHARAHLNIGNALLAQGEAAQALEAFTTALAHKPGYAAAYYNMGNAHSRLGEVDSARRAHATATELDPEFADAWVALGNVLDDLQLPEQAIESYEQALRLKPGYAQVEVNVANVLRQMGRLDAAAQRCRKALAAEPRLAQAHITLGQVLQDQRHWEPAQESFRTAARLDGNSTATLAQAYHCANQLCDWRRREEDEPALSALVSRGTPNIPPFPLLSLDRPDIDSVALQRAAAKRFAECTLGSAIDVACELSSHGSADGRLRIGYLSSDFHNHATMHLLRGVLAAHDRSRFFVGAYSYGDVQDEFTEEARRSCEIFRDLRGMSDAAAAELIASDQISILVDLKGFTKQTRMGISGRRPAPVVVSWLGYPGTLGLPQLADYIIGDSIVSPREHASHFSETLALMPHCYQPNDRRRSIGPIPSRSEAGLPCDAFVFCSFNQSYKFGPQMFDIWCRLLREVPGSVLWLLAVSESTALHLRREAAARGVSADRLVFAPTLPLAAHLARLGLADLALDTYPYNSHTTGSDALWAGVPMVTRQGITFASRVGASLLSAVGLEELVTHDAQGYFSCVKALALNRARLNELRARLAGNRLQSPLFDTELFARDIERLYSRMWSQHQDGRRELITLEEQVS